MIKICLLLALTVASVLLVSAQKSQESFDNINLKNDSKSSSLSAAATVARLVDKFYKKLESLNAPREQPQTNAPLPQLAPFALKMFDNRTLGVVSTGDADIDRYIEESSVRYDIDPLLIYAQMNQESGFKSKSTSPKGASGLMQLMPDTARRFGVKSIYHPQQNIEAGAKYMRWLLNKFSGDVRLALAGYNAGEGAVKKYGNKIPPYRETQNYVTRIIAHYDQISTNNLAAASLK